MVCYIVPDRTVKGDTKSDSKIVRPLDSILVLIISFTTYTFTCLAWGLLLYTTNLVDPFYCTQQLHAWLGEESNYSKFTMFSLEVRSGQLKVRISGGDPQEGRRNAV